MLIGRETLIVVAGLALLRDLKARYASCAARSPMLSPLPLAIVGDWLTEIILKLVDHTSCLASNFSFFVVYQLLDDPDRHTARLHHRSRTNRGR